MTCNPQSEALNDAAKSVSVIIATKDRAQQLEDTLQTVLAQTVVPDEVIIVDQSGTDTTKNLVASLSATAGHVRCRTPHFIYVSEPALPGAGAARNAGIDLASCAILLFLDDDVLLERDYVEALLAVYRQYPSVGGVSGIVTNYVRPRFRERLLEQLFCIGPFHDERLPIFWNASALRHSPPIPIRKVSGCVMSLRRSALGDERFDCNYRGAGAEDVDLSWRVSRSFPIVLAPRARLQHLRTQSGPPRQQWLTSSVACQYYQYHRLWGGSFVNTLCFMWLNCGFLLVATVSSVRQRSFRPFSALLAGIRLSHDLLTTGSRTWPVGIPSQEHPKEERPRVPSPSMIEPSQSLTDIK